MGESDRPMGCRRYVSAIFRGIEHTPNRPRSVRSSGCSRRENPLLAGLLVPAAGPSARRRGTRSSRPRPRSWPGAESGVFGGRPCCLVARIYETDDMRLHHVFLRVIEYRKWLVSRQTDSTPDAGGPRSGNEQGYRGRDSRVNHCRSSSRSGGSNPEEDLQFAASGLDVIKMQFTPHDELAGR